MTQKPTTTSQKAFLFCPRRRNPATPTERSSETPEIPTQDRSKNPIRSAVCNVPTVMTASSVIATIIAYSIQEPSANSSFDISLQDVVFDLSSIIFVLASAVCSRTSENIDAENCVQPAIRRGVTEIDSIILGLIIHLNETNNNDKSAALLVIATSTAGALIAIRCLASPKRTCVTQLDSMIENHPLTLSVLQGARDATVVLVTSQLIGDKPVVTIGWTTTVIVRHTQMNSFDLCFKNLVKVRKQYCLETSSSGSGGGPADEEDVDELSEGKHSLGAGRDGSDAAGSEVFVNFPEQDLDGILSSNNSSGHISEEDRLKIMSQIKTILSDLSDATLSKLGITDDTKPVNTDQEEIESTLKKLEKIPERDLQKAFAHIMSSASITITSISCGNGVTYSPELDNMANANVLRPAAFFLLIFGKASIKIPGRGTPLTLNDAMSQNIIITKTGGALCSY